MYSEHIGQIYPDDVCVRIMNPTFMKLILNINYHDGSIRDKIQSHWHSKVSNPFYYDGLKIVTHLRYMSKADTDNSEWREYYDKGTVSDLFFQSTLKALISYFPYDEINVTIITQGGDCSHYFKQYENNYRIKIYQNKPDELRDLAMMIYSDIFIMSKSSFSRIANYYSRGLKIIKEPYIHALDCNTFFYTLNGEPEKKEDEVKVIRLIEERRKQLLSEIQWFWENNPYTANYTKDLSSFINYSNAVEKKRYNVEPYIPDFCEFKRWKGKKVLDLGCGTGTDVINFSREGALVSGIDISKEALIIARDRLNALGLFATLDFVDVESVSLLPLVRESDFDLVYSYGVLSHVTRPRRMIQEVRKVMKSKTEFRFSCFSKVSCNILFYSDNSSFGCLSERNSNVVSLSTTNNNGDKVDSHRSSHQRLFPTGKVVAQQTKLQELGYSPCTYFFSFEEIEEMLQTNGMKIIEIRKVCLFDYVPDEFKRGNETRYPFFEHLDDKTKATIEEEMGIHTLVTARLIGK